MMNKNLRMMSERFPVEEADFSYALFSTLIGSGALLALSSMAIMIFVILNIYWGDLRQPEIYLEEVSSATFKLTPKLSSLFAGEYFATTISMDTGGSLISSGKAVLNYDPNVLEHVGAYYLFRPEESKIAKDVNKGAVLIDFSFSSGLVGRFKLVNIIFKTKRSGSTKVVFDCSNTNLYKDGEFIVACDQGESAVLSVLNAQTGSFAAACSSEIPAPPLNLRAEELNKSGVARLSWDLPHNATHLSLYYGTEPGVYDYGVPIIGIVDHFDIHNLEVGLPYYFSMTATNGCVTSAYSNEISTTIETGEQNQVVAATDDLNADQTTDRDDMMSFGRNVLLDLLQRSPFKRSEFVAIFSILIVLVSIIVYLLNLYSPTHKRHYQRKVIW